ncbi:hypothetical protein EC973_000619 [Apophysomyces ossiformis]|uniref:sn-1-specific diacylglycerol lipase n=1 Tax=Apophysomyces ossiformis TaxID=679940 RepID=A0A8H7BY61_9FUNG|nr:hypothetical protein EC973_000619 [Apophysomyces ossiformis]
MRSGLMAAEESVRLIDDIFGSNQTSRAIASIITLIHREVMHDPDFHLANAGKFVILSALTKAMTAFAVLQNVTHRRTMQSVHITTVWKGLVVVEETNENKLEFDNEENDHTDIIQELEEILVNESSREEYKEYEGEDKESSLSHPERYNMYEIIKTTKHTKTETTRIRPIAPMQEGPIQQQAKYIIVKSEEEDRESFIAMVDQDKEGEKKLSVSGAWIEYQAEGNEVKQSFAEEGCSQPYERPVMKRQRHQRLKIMLSAVSKKLSLKKVTRQERCCDIVEDNAPIADTESECAAIDGPISTMSSTSETLCSAVRCEEASNQHQIEPDIATDAPTGNNLTESAQKAMDTQSSWGRLKLKGVVKRKSVTNLFLKGAEALNRKKKEMHLPPLPSINYLSKPNDNGIRTSLSGCSYKSHSNSVTSLTSIRTLTTRTYTTTPTPSQSQRLLVRSPSMPARQKQHPLSLLEREPDPRNFPRGHIVKNVACFMRYASAAYGESFMRILGIGDIPSVLPSSRHPNHHAFAHHTGVSIQDIILSSYTDESMLSTPQLHALVHYVTIDHSAKAVVLTCRGTLGLNDVLTDLTCNYTEFTLPANQQTYRAHGGMLEAAQLLAKQRGKVFQAVREGLDNHPSYGLVLCGHSLGAGVVSLLSVLWSEERHFFLDGSSSNPWVDGSVARDPVPFVVSRQSGLPAGRPIHCYTYGPPCVMSLELSEYCRGLITSLVHGYDIVSSLSLGLLKDFKNIAVSLHEDSQVADDILARIIGRRYRSDAKGNGESDSEDEQWFWALIKTMRADMRTDKLYPPGTIYLIESIPQLVQHDNSSIQTPQSTAQKTRHKNAHMVVLNRCDDVQARFSEVIFSRTMFIDHAPNMYEKAIQLLCRGVFGQRTMSMS